MSTNNTLSHNSATSETTSPPSPSSPMSTSSRSSSTAGPPAAAGLALGLRRFLTTPARRSMRVLRLALSLRVSCICFCSCSCNCLVRASASSTSLSATSSSSCISRCSMSFFSAIILARPGESLSDAREGEVISSPLIIIILRLEGSPVRLVGKTVVGLTSPSPAQSTSVVGPSRTPCGLRDGGGGGDGEAGTSRSFTTRVGKRGATAACGTCRRTRRWTSPGSATIRTRRMRATARTCGSSARPRTAGW
mmetsp:Transcript_27472/g.87369  ORF Transcript_27472/g.87369 Transcript_27472/m.87369 type:complete len:250 (-) Transcript_27472:1960-2709(-)